MTDPTPDSRTCDVDAHCVSDDIEETEGGRIRDGGRVRDGGRRREGGRRGGDSASEIDPDTGGQHVSADVAPELFGW